MRTISVVVCALALYACSGSLPPVRSFDKTFSPAELHRDAERMRAVLTEGHPALLKYRTVREIDSIFSALDDSVGRPMTALEFWQIASLAVAGIRDDHTSLLPNDSVYGVLYRNPGRSLPMRIAVINDSMYIVRNYLSGGSSLDGGVILSVNDMPAKRFLDRCKAIVPTDGFVALRAAGKIERDFEGTCALIHGLPSELRLVVRDSSGATRSVVIPTVSWKERQKLLRSVAPQDTLRPPHGSLSFANDSMTAVLTIRSFDKSDDFNPSKFIASSFETIRRSRARSLIIDMRGNTGGEDRPAARLYANIAQDTFTYYTRRVVNKKRFDLLKGTDDWMLNYMIMLIPKQRLAGGRFALRMGMDKPMRPADGAFKGSVFLLLDRSSVSTSSEFGSVFKARNRGTIIGEESGSALTGGTGATVAVVLPSTRLILNLPLMTAYIAPSTKSREDGRRGVMPDVTISRSISDLLAGRDAAMDSALTLARAAFR